MSEQLKPGTRVLVLQMPELRVGTCHAAYSKHTLVNYEHMTTPEIEETECCHVSRDALLAAIAEAKSELVGIEYKLRNGEYDDWLTGAAPVAADEKGGEP
jgi:hypothetical protein